jgi:(S)-3,5-dihydroxyphenylglycine transaminase
VSALASMRLERSDLHRGLEDPVLQSMSFLNEIMSRFPDAISFAPGAPHPSFLSGVDVAKYIESYVDHRCKNGVSPRLARQSLYEYGPSQGIINDIIAESLRVDAGILAKPSDIVVTVGAQEAMLLLVHALCPSQRDLLAVVSPCYVGILGAAKLLDVEVVAVEEAGDSLAFDQLARVCRVARKRGHRVRALYVAPDFSNPSGTRLTLQSRMRLLDAAEAEDFLLLEDNAYAFTADPLTALPTLKALDKTGRVVLIGTFSKVCFPGVRVGFLLADQIVRSADGSEQGLAECISLSKSMVTVNTSPVAQAIVGGMLIEHRGSFAELGREKSALYRRNLGLLVNTLDRRLRAATGLTRGVTWNHPSGGFFVRMRLPVRADLALLEISASKFGVLWMPMSTFYVSPKGGTDELRLSCSYLEPNEITEGVERLVRFVRSLRP